VMPELLADKTAIITGASSGLGRSLAATFVDRGARVVGVARRSELLAELAAELNDERRMFTAVTADVSLPDDCRRLVDTTIATYGTLDIVVNNAGVGGEPGAVEQLDEDDWDKVVDVNLKGPAFVCRHALPHLVERGGVILNIASINAVLAVRGLAAYNASKAGLVQLSNTIAVEYGNRGVRCNAIVLGGVASEMNDALRTKLGQTIRGPAWVPEAPPRSGMAPDAVARALALLCSDDAAVINGATIAIDSGTSAGRMRSNYIYLASAELLPHPDRPPG